MRKVYYIPESDGRFSISESVSLDELLEITRHIISSKLKRSDPLTDPHIVRQYLYAYLANKEREVFLCLFLDNRHRVIHDEILFYGTINQASVYPREIIKAALEHNAAALILAHNHPSGICEPSTADKRLTNRIVEACKTVDIRVLDHFVIGGAEYTSFAERGLI